MSGHLDAWGKYCEARLQAEQMKEAASKAWQAFKIAEAELVDAMLEDEVTSWKDTDGANVGLRRQFSIACNQENAQEVEDWLQLTTGDAQHYMKTALDKASVQAYVKDQVESGELEEANVPDFLKMSTRPGITVRGWEQKKATLS